MGTKMTQAFLISGQWGSGDVAIVDLGVDDGIKPQSLGEFVRYCSRDRSIWRRDRKRVRSKPSARRRPSAASAGPVGALESSITGRVTIR
jgi:hypothetical protein